jgi:hypothetical protein
MKHGAFSMIPKANDKTLERKRPKEALIWKSQMEIKINTVFDIKDIGHFESIPQGQIIIQDYYL